MKGRGDVLLVDDDAGFRAVLGEVLKAEGCSVREAANGRDALEMARERVPDLIVTDLGMPKMSGWELCAELGRSKQLARVPVAIVSGTGRTLPRGVPSLRKPLKLADLLALLESILPA
jgi:CheY-like chemotaxis protein